MQTEIRPGTIDDWKDIDRINRAVLPENYDEKMYHALLTSPTTICYVAVTNNDTNTQASGKNEDMGPEFDDELDEGFPEKDMREIVGYIIVVLQFDNLKRLSAHTFSIGILEEYRRQGIGARLLGMTEQTIRTKFQAVRSITLHVRKTNKSAYKFYCKTGYSRAKVVKKYYQTEDAYLMKKMMI